MPIWCEPGEKKTGEKRKKFLPPPCKPFTFIITLNSSKVFESNSYILGLYEQRNASKIDDTVKLDLDFCSWITSHPETPTRDDGS